MNADATTPQPDAHIVAAAIDWLVQLRCERTPALCAACSRWRAQHPDHELAWQRICALDRTLCRQYRDLHACAATRALDAALRHHHLREPNPFSCVSQDSHVPPSPAATPSPSLEKPHASTPSAHLPTPPSLTPQTPAAARPALRPAARFAAAPLGRR